MPSGPPPSSPGSPSPLAVLQAPGPAKLRPRQQFVQVALLSFILFSLSSLSLFFSFCCLSFSPPLLSGFVLGINLVRLTLLRFPFVSRLLFSSSVLSVLSLSRVWDIAFIAWRFFSLISSCLLFFCFWYFSVSGWLTFCSSSCSSTEHGSSSSYCEPTCTWTRNIKSESWWYRSNNWFLMLVYEHTSLFVHHHHYHHDFALLPPWTC